MRVPAAAEATRLSRIRRFASWIRLPAPRSPATGAAGRTAVRSGKRRAIGAIPAALVLGLAACATPQQKSTPETPPQPARPAVHAAPSWPKAALAPEPPAPALRIGLKSDVGEFTLTGRGNPWTVVTGGGAYSVRGPLDFLPVGRAAAPVYSVQAGAFTEQKTADAAVQSAAALYQVPGRSVFSADKGLYRVRLGPFADRPTADALAARLSADGTPAFVVTEPGTAAGASIDVTDGAGRTMRVGAASLDVVSVADDTPVRVDGRPYRGRLRLIVNSRGTLNVVNVVWMEDYLRGVIPAEMGPHRFDELEALKAQAVAARSYALHRLGQFDDEGYDLCATPKCQVYEGMSVEDPLSDAAVAETQGLVLSYGGRVADALFTSTCGGMTDSAAAIFGTADEPYLSGVPCGEAAVSPLVGAELPVEAPRALDALGWRGLTLERAAGWRRGSRRHAGRRPARKAIFATAQQLAGVPPVGSPPPHLTPAAVYASLIPAFSLAEAVAVHLDGPDRAYDAGPPAADGKLEGSAQDAYDLLLRMNFGMGVGLPPPDSPLSEEQYAGLLLSAALRLNGVAEVGGRFVARQGGDLLIKTRSGTISVPADPDELLARRVGDSFFPTSKLELRAGDEVAFYRRGDDILSFWSVFESGGASYDRESAWTEWSRRFTGKEIAVRLAGRIPGTEVRSIRVLKRTPAGRAVEARVETDAGSGVLRGFDLRQALGLPELLFTVTKVKEPSGAVAFSFLGRGWGHGVGLCQNGAYGMALAGATYDQILRHYYTGIDLVRESDLKSPPEP